MSNFNANRSSQVTRQQISSEPTIQPIVIVKNETVYVEEITKQSLFTSPGNSWIVGSSTNGIVGTNTNTLGGGQQVVGSSGKYTIPAQITNPNNRMIERFNLSYLQDTDNTDATGWGTGTLTFTTGQVATSSAVYFDSSITKTVTLSQVTGTNTDNLSFEVSTDGNVWQSITSSITFTNDERALYWRATASGSATLTDLIITYTKVPVQETQNWIEVAGNQMVDGSGNNLIFL